MTAINTCFNQVLLFGLNSHRETVTNTTFTCDNIISCLNLLCEISDVTDVSMNVLMRSSFNEKQTNIIYNQSDYDKIRLLFILLLCYFGITIIIPICYYGYKFITTYIRRVDYIGI